eukprot:scaffold93406_cov33-Prasinocladus_malaysianus.AAC.3
MAWLMRRYLSHDLKIFVSGHRKSEVARHAAVGLHAMDANCKGQPLIIKPPHIRRLSPEFITVKPQLDDEDTPAYFDAVQQRKTAAALEASGLTFTCVEHIQSFPRGLLRRSGDCQTPARLRWHVGIGQSSALVASLQG